ncbi:acyl-CoA dehydrogenase family protein [Azospirillum halopraeferens]|uniref:acyl-CoA dehydrogenase family protein n=1 Tax=Azospirillum halopraeferens TaxID=34010 RepID=UPI0003F57E0E|nr:acyl-CoA dehydrogenase family protein [Azospirillum halopraeferens]
MDDTHSPARAGLSEAHGRLSDVAAGVAHTALAPRAQEVDREARWPRHAFEALATTPLPGLHVPSRLGGLGEGLLALAVVTEELGAACSSSAMCYGMHCVATKVLAVKATPDQEERYLRPIAAGRHVTTLALSEPGTGVHFYLPQTVYAPVPGGFRLDGVKSFVTSGGHADSYVLSAMPDGAEMDPGTFSCFVVDGATPGLEWQGAWDGLGMRGNGSRAVRIAGVRVPADNLLGRQGDELWYVFDVIAPYFLVAMGGTYLGVARAALDLAVRHLREREHAHSGQALADLPVLAHEVADAWIAVNRSRQLLRHAARLGDEGSEHARHAIFAGKVEVAETAVRVTNTAMTLGGGRAYQANAHLARLLRDARAADVMAPTTHVLKTWLGRSLLGRSPF